MRNKKAISPLIATILLIGFAIAIAILVWLWYGNVVNGTLEKMSASNDAKMLCSTYVKYNIKSICLLGSNLVINIENKGVNIDDFKITMTGDTSKTDTATLGMSLSSSQTKQINAPYNNANIGALSKAVVTPVIIRQGTSNPCTDKSQEIKTIKICST